MDRTHHSSLLHLDSHAVASTCYCLALMDDLNAFDPAMNEVSDYCVTKLFYMKIHRYCIRSKCFQTDRFC